ncbi:hypothetical protein CAEBREN_23384 [Caenorhabditis brenneri]|uniref:Sdz-33 F-box domain-containing protein n=1 Tax=Caenorhabditis brenneri TaxID=135651 RepID=G0N0H8_CAEBE|nr:hypothetical protein CAEBREN_23384 [Caenorhabditis brenneri]
MYWGMGAYGRKKKLTAPESVVAVEYSYTVPGKTEYKWEKNDLTMQYWFKHLQDIFNCHKSNYIHFSDNSSQFDIDDLKQLLGNTAEVYIENTGCYTFNQMILQKFSPLEKLSFRTSIFPNSTIPEGILMQNFDKLQIGIAGTIPLDQLLLTNSKIVCIAGLQQTAKKLNKFIRLWQSGSNPRMEYLSILYNIANRGDKEVIMKGIKHAIIPADHERKFKMARNGSPKLVKGGIDIVRVDGVKATIRYHPMPSLEMFVWFDHCVMET